MNATRARRPGSRVRGLGVGLLLTCAALALTACGNTVQVRGNTPDPEDVAGIQPGIHSRQDIIDLLGSPSTVSTFEDRKWYYIGQKTQQVAFMKPEVLDRNVLVITFDETGLVRSEEHTSELQSLMRISYAVFCLKKKNHKKTTHIQKLRT